LLSLAADPATTDAPVDSGTAEAAVMRSALAADAKMVMVNVFIAVLQDVICVSEPIGSRRNGSAGRVNASCFLLRCLCRPRRAETKFAAML
jgi:hypothetical protein